MQSNSPSQDRVRLRQFPRQLRIAFPGYENDGRAIALAPQERIDPGICGGLVCLQRYVRRAVEVRSSDALTSSDFQLS